MCIKPELANRRMCTGLVICARTIDQSMVTNPEIRNTGSFDSWRALHAVVKFTSRARSSGRYDDVIVDVDTADVQRYHTSEGKVQEQLGCMDKVPFPLTDLKKYSMFVCSNQQGPIAAEGNIILVQYLLNVTWVAQYHGSFIHWKFSCFFSKGPNIYFNYFNFSCRQPLPIRDHMLLHRGLTKTVKMSNEW